MATIFDLSTLNLPSGAHNITVKAKAKGYNDSAESNAVSYTVEGESTETTYTLSGTYILNETLTAPTQSFFADFETDKVHTTFYDPAQHGIFDATPRIWVNSDYCSIHAPSEYYNFTETRYNFSTNEWVGTDSLDSSFTMPDAYLEEVRTIVFDEPQAVSEEFYTWFTANAVQQYTVEVQNWSVVHADTNAPYLC